MGKKALRKDLLMEIRKNKGRFLSIFLIVALGVSFFSGLRVTEHDMRYTADAFSDGYQMMDVRILGTLGLTDEDMKALSAVKGVDQIEGSKMQYVLTTLNDVDCVLELTAAPTKLNQIQLTEGRMPKYENECLIDNTLKGRGLRLGDTLTLKEDGETELEDNLTQTAFKIVGFGDAPLYIGMERGSATLGNGQVSGFVIVEPEVFKQEYYTQIYLTIDDAFEELAFTESYTSVVEQVITEIKALEEVRCLARFEEIYTEAEQEIADGEAEYEEKKAEAEQELADARQELDDGWKELKEGKQEFADGKLELEDTKAELEDTKTELEDTKAELEEQLAEVLATKDDLLAKRDELTDTKEELLAQREELVSTKADLEAQKAEVLAAKSGLEAKRAELAVTKADLEAQQAQALAAKSELEAKQAELLATKKELETQRPGLVAIKTELEAQRAEVVAQQTPLLAQKAELDAAKATLDSARAEAVAQKTELEAQREQMLATKAELETQIPALQAQQSELESQRIQVQLAIGALEIQVSARQTNVSTLEYTQNGLAERRAALEARRAELEALAAAGTPDRAGEIQLAIEDGLLTPMERENAENLASARANLEEAQNNLNEAANGLAQINHGLAQIAEALPQMQDGLAQINTNLPLVEDGLVQINAGLTEIDTNLATVNDGLSQLNAGLAEIENGLAQIDDGLAQTNDGLAQIDTALPQINDGLAQIGPALTQINSGLPQLADGLSQVNGGISQIDAGLAEINGGLPQLEDGLAQVNDGLTQIDEGLPELNDGLVQIEDGLAEVEDGIAQLANGLIEVEDGLIQVNDGLVQVEEGFSELEEGEAELIDAEEKLTDGEIEYADAKAEADEQLADAKKEIDDAWKTLEELEVPSWYVTDRDDLPGYFEFGANAERIGAIGKVFPAIFFMVAALVALTAITRMVEEQRTQIGTYKALGYSKLDITFKYLAYALMATLGGGIVGVLIGEKLFPFVIIICYRIMYTPLLDIRIPYDLGYGLLSIGIAVFSTVAATLFACWHTLSAQPAILMRPVAPKAGKRVFLERIGILWSHLSFSQKATFRNLFRYKKRLIMTIFGIGCCCGLVVVGFGLKDSIMNIASIQYDNIQLYDAMVSIDEDIDAEDQTVLEESLADDERLISHAKLMMKSMDAQTDEAIRTVYVIVTEHKDALDTMMVFRNRDTHEMYEMDDEGVMISEQLSNALGVTIGDTISLQSGNTIVKTKVSGISENYLMHYVYMTETVYKEAFGGTPPYNMYWLDLTEQGKAQEAQLGKSLIEMDGVLTVNYISANRESIEQMLNSLYLIVIVLVIAASLLAFVVLYNLNNINISERRRELATLKLLGFHNIEVAAYVYRENIYLTLIGAVAGLGMGKVLHRFVINTIEVSQIMFGREITSTSYLICIGLTCLFSVIVNGVMFFQLKKIDMVESLKSVE